MLSGERGQCDKRIEYAIVNACMMHVEKPVLFGVFPVFLHLPRGLVGST
jgi:hypothetical protein